MQLRQLTDQETFVEHCVGHEADEGLGLKAVPAKQLCFLAFLPHILDSRAEGRNQYLKVLRISLPHVRASRYGLTRTDARSSHAA